MGRRALRTGAHVHGRSDQMTFWKCGLPGARCEDEMLVVG
jgi:hypothetical protein